VLEIKRNQHKRSYRIRDYGRSFYQRAFKSFHCYVLSLVEGHVSARIAGLGNTVMTSCQQLVQSLSVKNAILPVCRYMITCLFVSIDRHLIQTTTL
jgi:hypothetical protein